jgi:hypothetical protein
MEGDWFSFVDPRETCASFSCDFFGDLMNYMFRSGVWEKRPMVRFNLHIPSFEKLMDG